MRFKLIGLICLIMQCNLSCTQHIINKETVQTLDLFTPLYGEMV